MKISQRLKKDRERIRSLSPAQKRQFIWDYYKLPVIAAASVVVLAALTLVFNAGRGDTVMYAVLVNADDRADESVFTRLLEEGGMDMTGKEVGVAAGYRLGLEGGEITDVSTVQVLAALFGIGDLDLFAADESVFASYAAQDAFVDISLFVDGGVLAAHEEDLYRYLDSYDHEIVGGIWLRESSPLHEAGYYTGDVLIGAAAQAEHIDEAVAVLKQLLK